MENISIYEELIEGASQSSKLLILSQLAIDDGDLALSQKYFLEVKDILTTLNKDTFLEIKELCSNEVTESDDYDISSLHLACLLNDACHTAGVLIGMELENQPDTIKASILNKICKTINAISELFETLFN